MSFTQEELACCETVLRQLRQEPQRLQTNDPNLIRIRTEIMALQQALKKLQKNTARRRDRVLLKSRQRFDSSAPTFGLPALPITSASDEREVSEPRNCYICKSAYRKLHHFYDSLCPTCGDFNLEKREQSANLSGRIALVTGGRIKIGFQVALKLLRAGATVLVVTRFPNDAARRYAREPDFSSWEQCLRIYGLDLRCLRWVEEFAANLCQQYAKLDILINNAAQTVRRPPTYYRSLVEQEASNYIVPADVQHLIVQTWKSRGYFPATPLADDNTRQFPLSALLTQLPLVTGDAIPNEQDFPMGVFDAHDQPLDKRARNSWRLRIGEVATEEVIETHAVNILAPFVLISKLEPLLLRDTRKPRYIVNVSAVEGQFSEPGKTAYHPHTNMAKAGLNMLTRTCAEQYAKTGIFMNSVDTGWVSHEAPHPTAEKMKAEGFRVPLDLPDAAARICDPIFSSENTGARIWGQYLKDYRPAPW